jgi:hypothetical protein
MNSQQYGMVQVDNNRYRFFYDVSGQYLIEQVTAGYEILHVMQGQSTTVRSLKLASQYVITKLNRV